MKNIKQIKLKKYDTDNYSEVAFNIFYNKIAKNFCFCFEADSIEQYPLEDLLDQYLVNCTEYYGQKEIIDGEEKNIAEVETLSSNKEDLIQILNFSTIVGNEIINIEYSGFELLVKNYEKSNIIINEKVINVPIVADRSDRTGMTSFLVKYPEMQYKKIFTSGKHINIEIENFDENKIKYILLQNDKAKIIYGDDETKEYAFVLSELNNLQ